MVIIKKFSFFILFVLINKRFFLAYKLYLNPKFAKYEVIKLLYEEPFSEVYKVYNRDDDNIYIIKRIYLKGKSSKEIEYLKDDVEKLSNINGEYIIKYFDYFLDNDTFNIVMEYCEGTDLKSFIELFRRANIPIKREFILIYIYYISLGLKEIHKNNIIHKEIKPENLFITNDYKIKIGGFGIINRINPESNQDKTQITSPSYSAPELIKGLKYDSKVDIWSFGCIIYELCSLNYYCFSKNKEININKYGELFQNIIDITLNEDRNKRPSAEEILEILEDDKKEILGLLNGFKMDKLVREDTIIKKYLLEKSVFSTLDKEILNIMNYNSQKYLIKFFGILLTIISNYFFKGVFGGLFSGFFYFVFENIFGFKEKEIFIRDNMKIVRVIINDLLINIFTILNEKIAKEKTINIYNIKTFRKKANFIEKEITSYNYIRKLKRKIIKKFNILLLGNTNVGKSTLINEFLKLPLNERAKESTGGPTKTSDFTSYNGNYNEVNYSLYDTNGITNKGENSIENKIKNTEEEIKKRIKNKDPNELFHCIWYCFQGSNIQPSDGDFIKKLITIYNKYSIPIIFVHTQTYSISQSKTCKKGIKKYLGEIYKNESDIKSHLNNYINILAREDSKIEDDEEEDEDNKIKDCINNNIKSFGLDKLENISRKEIKTKGLKSSYYEYIREEIKPMLINGAFKLFFTDNNIKVLADMAIKDLKKYINTTLDLFNDEQLNLSDIIKERNKKSLNNLYESFQKIKENLKDNLKDCLSIKKLKDKYDKNVGKIYDFKSSNYKNNMNYDIFCKNVEELIYNNINKNSDKILEILANLSFNNYVIENIKLGIEEHFLDIEEKIINKIYKEIFESFDSQN